MSWNNNLYYNPEDSGLTKVAELELTEPFYSFDLAAAWRDTEGQFYLGTDSGCSCPTPFENFASIADLTGPLTAAQVIEEATSLALASPEPSFALEGLPEFLADVMKAEVS